MSTSSSHLYIPIKHSSPPESVSVSLSSLPSDSADLIGVLSNEVAPPSLWLRFALEYFGRGQVSSYLDLLSAITGEEATAAYSAPEEASVESRDARIAILCSLAGYETWAGWSGGRSGGANGKAERERYYQLAIEHLNQATELDYTSPLTWVGKGLLLLVQGDWDDSLHNFNNAIANDAQRAHGLAHVGRALCLYHKAAYTQAVRAFQQALTVNPQLDPALMLGLGLCYVQGKDTAAAARVFSRVLDKQPDNVDALAALAVLELNEAAETQRQALTAAGSVATSTSPASAQRALSLLARAYSLNPSHPLTLVHLAQHFVHAGHFHKARVLSSRALAVLDASQHGLRCEAHLQLARAHHAQDDFAAANTTYGLARKENEAMQRKALAQLKQPVPSPLPCSHPLLALGLSQMLIHKADYAAARIHLAHLHAHFPNDHDVLRLLGAVQLRLRAWKEAEPLLGRAVAGSPKDVELLCEWAAACEQVEGKKAAARDALVEAARLIREEHGRRPPFQLLHNVGALCQELGQPDDARRWYHEALDAIEQEEAADGAQKGDEAPEEKSAVPAVSVAASVTTRYNLALLQERTSPHAPLAELAAPYLALTERFPTYLDAHLRLGTLHESHSSYEAARAHYEAVLQQQERHLEGRTLLANFMVRRGQLKAAEKEYKLIALWTVTGKAHTEGGRQQPGAAGAEDDDEEDDQLKGDTYAMLALANLFQQQARLLAAVPQGSAADSELLVLRVTSSKAKEGATTSAGFWRERAGKYYRSVLANDGTNVYAAHGLACLLAEQGDWGRAKEVLTLVREALDGYVDAALNLGHVHTAQQAYAAAVKAYDDVVDKLLPHTAQHGRQEQDDDVEERRTDALVYRGRAYFLWGLLEEAVASLDAAVQRRGSSALLWYNRALAQEEYAIAVLRKKVEERTLDEVTRAVQRLGDAHTTFARLEEAAKLSQRQRQRLQQPRNGRKDEDDHKDDHKEHAAADGQVAERKEGGLDGPERVLGRTAASAPSDAATAAAPSSPAARLVVEVSASGQLCPPPASLLDCSTCAFLLDEKAHAHAVFCRETLSKAHVHLAAAQAREAELGRIAERARAAKEEAEQRARLEREERAAREREEAERAEQVARDNKTKLASLQENWTASRRQEREDEDDAADAEDATDRRKRKARRKKGRRGSVSDEDAQAAADEDDADLTAAARRKKAKRRRTDEPRDDVADVDERPPAAEDGVATTDAAADAVAVEEVPEWKRLREERSRQSRVGALIPALAGEGDAESSVDGAEAENASGDARSKRRLRRAQVEVEDAADSEPRVRGLDEEDAPAETEEVDEVTVGAERGEAARRSGARRKAIVEDDGDDADFGEDAAAPPEGEERLLALSAEHEAPIYAPSSGSAESDAHQQAEVGTRTVSAEAMDTE